MTFHTKIYLELRVITKTTEDYSLIISEISQKLIKFFPDTITYEQDRLFMEIDSSEVDRYKIEGRLVAIIDDKPNIILSRTSFELNVINNEAAHYTLEGLKEANLLDKFAVVEIIQSKFTNILGL